MSHECKVIPTPKILARFIGHSCFRSYDPGNDKEEHEEVDHVVHRGHRRLYACCWYRWSCRPLRVRWVHPRWRRRLVPQELSPRAERRKLSLVRICPWANSRDEDEQDRLVLPALLEKEI